MNTKLRLFAGILSGLVLAGGVTACGGDDDASGKGDKTETTKAGAKTETTKKEESTTTAKK